MSHRRTLRPVRLGGPLLAVVVWAAVSTAGGCSSTHYLRQRDEPTNPLSQSLQLLSYGGPQPSARTEALLRRYDLSERRQKNPAFVLAALDKEIKADPQVEKFYAFAELAYVDGKKAEASGDVRLALDCYGAAVCHAYLYLFDSRLDRVRNPYDPQFRQACDVYNESLEAALRLWNANRRLKPGMQERMTVAGKEIELTIDLRGNWPADELERLEFVSDYEIVKLTNRHHTYGLGVPLIGVRRPRNDSDPLGSYYPKVLAFPVTAFLRVEQIAGVWNPYRQASASSASGGPPTDPSRPPPLRCVLELHDPLQAVEIQAAGRTVPLETDLTTPLAYLLDRPALRVQQAATFGLLQPDQAAALKGVYMLEPFDPQKIPVIMVHGLWSSPLTWMEQFNDLRAMPEVRRRYQFWFYMYPTGQPFWASAAEFRKDLAELYRRVDPQRSNPALQSSILVGHSMGGLVSMLQTVDSGDALWKMLSDKPFEELKADEETRARLASVLFFQPNPAVSRVVTIGTPHRGSDYANDTTRWLSHKLIDMPARMLQARQRLITDNPDVIRSPELLTISTSIDSLAPGNPIFKTMDRLPRADWVRYHNIIGLVSTDSLLGKFSQGSDGVVSFESARLEDVDSELVVEADHTFVHDHPRSILEVRRILLEHAAEFHARQDGRSPPVPAAQPVWNVEG